MHITCITKKNNLLAFIFSKWCQYIVYGALLYLITYNITIPIFNNYIYSLLFIVIILNLSSNKKSILNVEYEILNYLGKISFGIYMYHPLCIGISYTLIEFFLGKQIVYTTLTVYLLLFITLTFSLIISATSYHFFERKFFKFKTYFEN